MEPPSASLTPLFPPATGSGRAGWFQKEQGIIFWVLLIQTQDETATASFHSALCKGKEGTKAAFLTPPQVVYWMRLTLLGTTCLHTNPSLVKHLH